MVGYDVLLEIAEDGLGMAHVAELPGLVVRGVSRDEVMAALPVAIRQHVEWLRRHGEERPAAGDEIALNVVESQSGTGPFRHGDVAASFSIDGKPLSRREMEEALRRAGYSRADLLALTRDLPDEVLDWRPAPGEHPIRRVLRHIGNAEEWYVSRLVHPDTLPPEWRDDEAMAIFDFLEMERRTVVERFRQVSDGELGVTLYPTHFTSAPGEPWTARKAIRRFQEHELEHLEQVRQILGAWRGRLLADLAEARAELLWPLLGLDEATLAGPPVFDDYTAAELLAHVGAWDAYHTAQIGLMVAGRLDEIGPLDLDGRNADLHAEQRYWPLGRAIAYMESERARFLATLAEAPDEFLYRPFGEGITPIGRRAEWRARHDRSHTGGLRGWRAARPIRIATGPIDLLLAVARATRAELLALVERLAPAERASRLLVEEWTLHDILGHVLDWEVHGLTALRQLMAPPLEFPGDEERQNAFFARRRRGQSWAELMTELAAVRREFMALVEERGEAGLIQVVRDPLEGDQSAYEWVVSYLEHEREHAAAIRAALGS
jgi:predicted RNase H-like HicB family nuclease/uncharacterized damage-inducible protein DinB